MDEPLIPEKIIISLQIKPEVNQFLTDLKANLANIDTSLKEIKTSLAEALHKIFEFQEEPPGLPEVVIAEEESPATGAKN